MSRKRKAVPEELPVWPEPLAGGKYLRMLDGLVQSLRLDEAHGNQQLFLDDVFVAHLLAFFNPTLKSLRTLEDFSQTRQGQRHLSVRRLCRSTLSDFHRLADPTLLEPIIHRLRQEAQRWPQAAELLPGLPTTLGKVLAVDGSFFSVAADVAWAVGHRFNNGRTGASVRLDMHLDVATWLPEVIGVSGCDQSEAEHAARHVQPGAIHVYDRGIFSFELLEAQQEAGAYFVHRLREAGRRCPMFVTEESLPLTAEDIATGVLSDHRGRMAGSAHRRAPDVMLREIVIDSPDEPGGQIRLVTNLLDIEARIVGLLYRYRWQVELFFRWLKTYANFAHLISHSRPGVLLSFYVAVIGTMLTYLHSDARPNKYTFSLLGVVANGGATLDEIVPILKERERQIALAKASAARRRAQKT